MSVPDRWHDLPGDTVLSRLGTGLGGLDEDEARERLRSHGLNRLPEPARRHVLTRFLAQFRNILIYVLLAAAVVTATLGHPVDTAVIVAVVIVNALIGFVQEGKAEKAMDALRLMLAPSAAVVRNGQRRTVDGEELVPGDLR